MASRMAVQHLQKLQEELARVSDEIRTLEGKREGLRMAISVMRDEAPAAAPLPDAVRKSRGPLKDLVLRLLGEAGERGLVAVDTVDLAKAQGIELDRGSVSSLLSRFKKEGVVEHVNGRYRIPRPFPREVKDAA